jgi:radical SAM superfamily enzyme YgiQ (UPF0313 family)
VTGFFGDTIRFRSNHSVVDEMLRLKRRAAAELGQAFVFFVDDNFAINTKRTKSLLRAIIAAEAQLPYIAQISINLLRDEELVDLLTASGAKAVYIGMESIDPANLADVKKGFNKPAEYAAILNRLAQGNIIAMMGFIFGLDYDTPGVAERTLEQMGNWPPGLPVFSQLTPYPSTPLYARLKASGRLTRPHHWLEFSPFQMAHEPLGMTPAEVHAEIHHAWLSSYSAEANARAIDSIRHKSINQRLHHLIARLFFRGIYFPQMTWREWARLLVDNRRLIIRLARELLGGWRPFRSGRALAGRRRQVPVDQLSNLR